MCMAFDSRAGPCVRPATFSTGSRARSRTALPLPSGSVTTLVQWCRP